MKKRQRLNQLLGQRIAYPYEEQYRYIMRLIEEGKITPVRRSAKNGKKPALYTEYWIIEEAKDYSAQVQELTFRTNPAISVDYYLKNPEVYLTERDAVRQLNEFLQNHRERLNVQVSFNERCFEIWGYEKFLSLGAGRRVLNHCGLSIDFLNCYPTAEPFAYYAAHRRTPQRILIVENKDPFCSMRRHLISGNVTILGQPVGTLIYGAGKRVVSSFGEFGISAEPYMQEESNTLLYFGDLDYEGIGIYEDLARKFKWRGKIIPFVPAYRTMLQKAKIAVKLPVTREHQNKNISGVFFSYFDEETTVRMKRILEKNLYIPQEILNISDF